VETLSLKRKRVVTVKEPTPVKAKAVIDKAARVDAPVQSDGPMDFAGALLALKRGARVARTGWNGKGMFLFLVPGSVFHVSRAPLLGIYPRGREIRYRPHIDMVAADGSVGTWVASQSDLLEADWVTVPGDGAEVEAA